MRTQSQPGGSGSGSMDFGRSDFGDIKTWIFDLDNTLYRVTPRLHKEHNRRMSSFIADFLSVDADEAFRIQKDYFRRYGLTLRGLMNHHNLDPDIFFDHMLVTDLSDVPTDPGLVRRIEALPGRKIVYTNSWTRHAETYLAHIGAGGLFDAVFDIVEAGFVPKPDPRPLELMCHRFDIDPGRAVMVDDIDRNLKPAADFGMRTVWLKTDADWAADIEPGSYIDHVIDDLATWLENVRHAP